MLPSPTLEERIFPRKGWRKRLIGKLVQDWRVEDFLKARKVERVEKTGNLFTQAVSKAQYQANLISLNRKIEREEKAEKRGIDFHQTLRETA